MSVQITDTHGQETIDIIEELANKAYAQALFNFTELDKTSFLHRNNIQKIYDVLLEVDRLFNHVIAVGDAEFEKLRLCFYLSVAANEMITDLSKILNQQ